MSIHPTIPALISLFAISSIATSLAAETAYTAPKGFYTLKIPGKQGEESQSRTYFGQQLLPGIIAAGKAGNVTGDSFNGSAGFSWSSLHAPNRISYLHVTSGPARGRVIDIVEFGTDFVRCAEPLTGFAPGDDFIIRRHSTLAEVFGATNRFGLSTGDDATNADNVVAWDPASQTERVFYFHSTRGRWEENDIVADAANAPLRYPYGTYIIRRTSGTLRVALSGEPAGHPVLLPVRNGSNVFSLPVNLSASLDALLPSGESHSVSGGTNASQADLLTFHEPTSGLRRGPYYFSTRPAMSGWREVGAGGEKSEITLDLLSTMVIRRSGNSSLVMAEGNLSSGPGFPPLPPDPEPGEIALTGEFELRQPLPNQVMLAIEVSTDLQTWTNSGGATRSGNKIIFPLPAGQSRAFYRVAISL